MADRVHPQDSPPSSGDHTVPHKPTPPPPEKPVPPPHGGAGGGTYVIQIPKDQIYRVPPPENSRRQVHYSRRKTRRSSCCCRFLCYLISLLLILIVLLGIAAAALYLIFSPKAPNYAIDGVSVKGVNLTAVATSPTAAAISPEFDVAVRADNPNKKIGIYYEKGSSVEVFYKKIRLCNGELPAFYQPSKNVTVFQTVLRGNDIELTVTDAKALVNAQSEGKVPLTLKLRAPVKIKVGSVKTWRITVKVDCDVTVDGLTTKARVVSKSCDYGVDLW